MSSYVIDAWRRQMIEFACRFSSMPEERVRRASNEALRRYLRRLGMYE